MRHSLARNLALGVLGLVTAALLIEGLLWLVNDDNYQALVYDPTNGLIHYQPEIAYQSTGTCYNLLAHINQLGLYGPDINQTKPPNTYRIVVVGSSFVEAIQVPLSERFDTLLQNELNAHTANGEHYEVIGLGFPANGTYLNMLYYKYYYAALHPDLVINLMTDSSLGKDAPTTVDAPQFTASGTPILNLPAVKRDSFVIDLKSAARQSKLFEALYHDFVIATTPVIQTTSSSTASTSTDPYADVWDSEAKLYPAFKSEVGSSAAKFMVASWTTDEIPNRAYMYNHLEPIMASSSIPYLDLTPIIDADQTSTGESAMLPCGGHWGVYGHEWVAEALYQYLTSHPSFL